MRGACSLAMRARISAFTRAMSPASAACSRSSGVERGRAAHALSTSAVAVSRLRAMRELLRTNDPTVIAFSTALLRGEDIDCFVLDVHMSVLEGSIGLLPRRVMVADRDFFRARAVLRDNERGRPACRNEPLAPRRSSRCDAFLDGRLRLWQPRAGYRAATDPVLLAAFVPARPGERVLELGCGAGAAALCLAARVPGLELHGLELQPAYAELARRNAAENGLPLDGARGRPAPAARRRCGALSFDHVLANPPFHPPAATPAPPTPGATSPIARARRRSPTGSTPGCAGSVPGGRLALIHRTARLGEILAGARRPGRGGGDPADRLARGAAGARVLVRARKGSRAPLTLCCPLTFHRGSSHEGDGETYTAEVQGVLRDMAALLPDARAGSS